MARLHFKSAIVDLFFLAGATLLLILIILSGSGKNPSFPLNRFYWIQADTNGIPNAYSKTRWAYWGICEAVGGKSKNCGDLGPAYPISPVDNFDTESNVPKYFVSNRDTFYYLSRVGWATLLIALVFSAISLIFAIFSICSFHVQKITAIFSFIATIMNFAAAALYTATVALAKKHFTNGKIGPILMGLVWASAVCNFIVLLTTFGACVRESYLRAKERYGANSDGSVYASEPKKSTSSGAIPPLPSSQPQQQAPAQYDDPYAAAAAGSPRQSSAQEPATRSGGINFFNIRRNRKADEESEI